MANKNAQRVNSWLIIALAAVLNLLMVGCEKDPYDREMETNSTTEKIAKPKDDQPVVPGLNFRFDYINRNHGWWLNTEWDIYESVTGFRDNGVSYNAVSHKDDRYAVEDKYREVSLQYTQERTSKGQLSTKSKSMSATRRVYADSVRWTANIEDGNLCYLDAIDERIEAEVRDTMRALPYVHTVNASVKAINTLPGTTRYMTRAAYVSDSICREVVWDVEKEVVTNNLVNKVENFHVELRDTFKVLLLTEDDIDHAEAIETQRVVLDETTERCSFIEKFYMKSGETHENPRNYILNYWIRPIDEWIENVTSFSFVHKSNDPIAYGNIQNGIRKENNWVVDGQNFVFNGWKTNNVENIKTTYNGYHEGCTYQDNWVTVEFPLINPTISERDTHVESVVSNNTNFDQVRLFNTINMNYQGYDQQVQETVLLQKPAVRIDREGWDEMNCIETIYNDSVVWIPTYIIHYSDGNEIVTRFRCSDTRSLEVLTNWNSIEENESESTGNVTVGEATTRNMSRTVNGAEFKWVRETRDLNNKAQLAGSTQNNGWRSVEPNAVTVTYRGKSYTFNRNSVQTTNTASVTGGAVNGGYKVYNYRDVLDYYFGENVKQATAPGTIRVLAKQLIREGWDNASAKEVWSDNRVDWTLDWVEEFSDGEINRTSFSWYDTRIYTVDTNWSSIEKNNNYNTSNYVVTLSNSADQSKNVNGAEFKWVRETHKINTNVQLAGSSQENRWTAVDPFNCSVTYKGKTYDFGRKSVSLSHRDNLSNGVEQGSYLVYTYGDAMSYTIAANTKTLTAPGEVKVLNKQIVEEGWDASSAKQIVTNFMVNWSVDYVVKFNTGEVERTNYSQSDMRSLEPKTNWTSIETNNTASTTNAVATVSNTASQSANVKGATFAWVRETRDITSTARLAGSSQNNKWQAVDPNNCTVTYNGKIFTFDRLTVSVSNSDNVTGGNEVGGYKVYNYSDNLTYRYGNDTKQSVCPGTIKVKVATVEPPFFPAEWGEIVEAKQTNANTESHKGSVCTWSLRFKNGYVLPVVVRPGATRPEWEFSYVEKTSVTTYNGGTYEAATGKWINTTAKDQPDHMIWARSGVERANKNYTIAKNENWDEGHLINGKASVKTYRYTLTITNGKLSATDTYTGTYMGTWTSYTGE